MESLLSLITIQAHLALVIACLILFLLRAISSFSKSTLPDHPWAVIFSKVLVSLLMLTGMLLWIAGDYSLLNGWLFTKLIGLILFVVLSLLSLKRNIKPKMRGLVMLLALALYGIIYLIASNHGRISLWFDNISNWETLYNNQNCYSNKLPVGVNGSNSQWIMILEASRVN